MSETLSHVAGVVLTVGDRVIQRCSLCGAKLCDSEGCMIATSPGEEPPKFPTWEVGRLIQVNAGNPTHFTLLPESEKLPEDTCLEFA